MEFTLVDVAVAELELTGGSFLASGKVTFIHSTILPDFSAFSVHLIIFPMTLVSVVDTFAVWWRVEFDARLACLRDRDFLCKLSNPTCDALNKLTF